MSPALHFALQGLLAKRFAEAQARRPGYSMRAFSKKVGLSATSMSLILRGHRPVSKKLIEKISVTLQLKPEEVDKLNRLHGAKIKVKPTKISKRMMSAAQHRIVGDWRAFAIMNLVKLQSFRNDPEWIGQRLGIPPTAAHAIFDDLLMLKLIVFENGKLRRTSEFFKTSDNSFNAHVRDSHLKNLELVRANILHEPLETRDLNILTLAFDPEQMPAMRKFIRQFIHEFPQVAGQNGSPTEVYRLSMQFFPLTKIGTP